MQFVSQSVGGTTPTGRGAASDDSTRMRPDVRFIINDRPLGPKTKDVDLQRKYASKGMELLTPDMYGDDVQYITYGIGSSTLIDTDGDVFHKSAQEGMARDSIDLNVLLNHVPIIPESIFGSILEANIDFLTLQTGEEHCILKLVNDVRRKEPKAWTTYEMIAGIDERPRKLGYSVGCLYIDAKPRYTKSGLTQGCDVYEVLPVEFSIVSMPANRLAWIETIGRDLQEKGVIPRTRAFADDRRTLREIATAQDTIERITDWMDFGPIDGPRLEKLAHYFEQEYGIVYGRRPRLQRSA